VYSIGPVTPAADEPLVVRGPSLALRYATPDDAEALFALASDPAVTRFFSWGPYTSLEQPQAYIAGLPEKRERGELLDFLIVHHEAGPIGVTGLSELSRRNRHATVGTWLGHRWWGSGTNPESKAMIAARAHDGRFGTYRFPAPATPQDPWPVGQWRPVLPAFGNDLFAWIKDVRPFLIRDPARYASEAPDDLTSKHYAREFNEVKTIGSSTSTTRTADQTDQARFWAEGPQIWTRAARQLAIERDLSPSDGARMFAMLYTTGADALISTWIGKARWLFWRPITAIREADRDGNPGTAAQSDWLPLINTPPYPDHPSGLSAVSAAMAEALTNAFGYRVRFSVTSMNSNTTRSFRSFSQAVDEVVNARVYSGIHFRKADDDAAAIGRTVARDGLRRYFERD